MTGDQADVQGDVVVVSVEALRAGPHLRESGLSQAHVLTLAELEGRWPPILVSRTDYVVIDGHHRLAAAERLGLGELRARLFAGSPDEAYVEFVHCNVGHGLPLSLRERKRAVGRILAVQPDWSDRRVARLCALSPTTVARLRAELFGDSDSCLDVQPGQSDGRVGQDGKVRSVHPERMRARVAELLSARPQSSLRAVAQEVGVSPETVRSVRNNLQTVKGLPTEHHGDGVSKRTHLTGPKVTDAQDEGTATTGSPVPDIAWLADMLDRGKPRATPPWEDDRAFTSLDGGARFLTWFNTTSVDEADCWRHLSEVPLSRVYMVADEARRRASFWSTFAAGLEDRVSKRAAIN